MGVVRNHARSMNRLVNAVPPRPGCVLPVSSDKALGAWIASTAPGAAAGERRCINAPEVSLAYYAMYGVGGVPDVTSDQLGVSASAVESARALRSGRAYVFPTKEACCSAGGLGAYPDGCTNA